jgi:IS66 Orf2 like protein
MIGLAVGTRIWIVAGVTDLRRGFTGLSGMVQTALKENPFSGQVFPPELQLKIIPVAAIDSEGRPEKDFRTAYQAQRTTVHHFIPAALYSQKPPAPVVAIAMPEAVVRSKSPNRKRLL